MMPESFWSSFVNSLINAGPTCAMLALVVWQLNKERIDRLDKMDKEIDRQRKRSDECEKDRQQITIKLVEATHKIADLSYSLAQMKQIPHPPQ